MVHSFNELYGEVMTGKLITSLTKLFLAYIQVHGFTCGLDDLMLKKKTNKMRQNLIEETHQYTVQEVCKNFGS